MPNRLQAQLAAPALTASKAPKASKAAQKPVRSATEPTGDGAETDPKPSAKKIMTDSGAFFVKPAPAKRKSA
jgi:hypothetical protein